MTLLDARASGLPPGAAASLAAHADIIVLTSSPLDRWQCPNVDLAPFFFWARSLPSSRLVVTGAHGTLFPEHILNATGAWAVVRGEPEGAVRNLCLELTGGGSGLCRASSLSFRDGPAIHHTPDGPPAGPQSFPTPAYDLTRPELYTYEPLGDRLAVLETSRGCSHRCLYCFKAMYSHGIRPKPLDRIHADIEAIVRNGYRSVYFMDLNLAWNRSRTLELCRLLRGFSLSWCCQTRVDSVDEDILKEMAAAGCRLIHYGIEGGSPPAWERMGKGISLDAAERAVRYTKKAGMATAGFFLGGFPWETAEDRRRTESLARQLAMTYASFHAVTCYAGTPLARLMGVSGPWWEDPPPSPALLTWTRRATWRTLLSPATAMEALRRGALRPEVLRLFLSFLPAGK